jgi:hypothetical protein
VLTTNTADAACAERNQQDSNRQDGSSVMMNYQQISKGNPGLGSLRVLLGSIRRLDDNKKKTVIQELLSENHLLALEVLREEKSALGKLCFAESAVQVVDNPSTWKHESKDGERVVSMDWLFDSISSIKLGQPRR